MNEMTNATPDGSHTRKPIPFPRRDGSRISYEVYTSLEINELEQERIIRGPTWSFVALEVELPNPGDFKSTFAGESPVVLTRNDDNSLSVWVNRCAHRGAMVCRAPRGNARKSHLRLSSMELRYAGQSQGRAISERHQRFARHAGRLRPEGPRPASTARRKLSPPGIRDLQRPSAAALRLYRPADAPRARSNLPQAHRLSRLHSAVFEIELEALLRKRQGPLPRVAAACILQHLQSLSGGDEVRGR